MSAALVEAHPVEDDDPAAYDIHPLVAETVPAGASPEVVVGADYELAAYWNTVFEQALTAEAAGQPATAHVAHAARRAVVYLLRLHEWHLARAILDHAMLRDDSLVGRAEAARILRHIAAGTVGTETELLALGTLAGALAASDPAAAEQLMCRVERDAAAAGRHSLASSAAGDLINLLMDAARFPEALEVVDRMAEHNRFAGLGPWTQLSTRGRRLQILRLLGQNEEVLGDVAQIVKEMAALPEQPGDDETARPWNVREGMFDVAFLAARDLRRWEEASAWLDKELASKGSRGATELELAGAQFNAYGPLLRLGRTADARAVLEHCRRVFEDHDAYDRLGRCLSALADLEYTLSHAQQAVDLERIAVRFKYLQADPVSVATSHCNLAIYLRRIGHDADAMAQSLAGVALYAVIASGSYRRNLRALAADLATNPTLPSGFAALCATVEQVEGVRFGVLVEALGGDGDALLATVLDDARAMAPEELYAEQLAGWETALALLVAVVDGSPHARARLAEHLARRAQQADWAELTERLAAMADGERDVALLHEGLDAIDTAVIDRAVRALAGDVEPDPAPEWLRPLMDAAVTVAAGRRVGARTPGEEEQAAQVLATLEELAGTDDWAELAAQLRQVVAGYPTIEWDGLDEIDAAILAMVLRRSAAHR